MRHFTLLVCLVALLIATRRWRIAPTPVAAFAVYGALHAAALAASLRAPSPLPRQLLFVASAAALCFATASLGLRGVRFIGALPGLLGPLALLGLTAGAGAFAYGVLIGKFWQPGFSPGTLAAIAALCTLTVSGAFLICEAAHALGGLWLAVPWWFAFSGGLWYHERRSDFLNRSRS